MLNIFNIYIYIHSNSTNISLADIYTACHLFRYFHTKWQRCSWKLLHFMQPCILLSDFGICIQNTSSRIHSNAMWALNFWWANIHKSESRIHSNERAEEKQLSCSITRSSCTTLYRILDVHTSYYAISKMKWKMFECCNIAKLWMEWFFSSLSSYFPFALEFSSFEI